MEAASTLTVAGLTATTGTVRQGSVFTIAGVFKVHPITKVNTGVLQQFVVTADAAANGSGVATLNVSPALYTATSKGLQNITALPASAAAVTFSGAANTSYVQNLQYHKNAFKMASVPLEMPTKAEFAAQETVDGITIAIVRDWDQGVLFERDKVVSNIVKNDDLSNEELANLVFTGSTRGQNLNAASGKTVRAMKLAAGDNADDLVANLRQGTFARILNKSTVNTQRAGSDVQMLSPAKLLKELDGLAANKTFMGEVFDEGQRNTIHALRADLRKVASEQPGSRNYSNTAYTVINFLRQMPLGLSSVAGVANIGLKPIAEKGARNELDRSLQDVIGKAQSELVGKAKMYGAAAGGGVAGKSRASAQNNQDENE